jgi:hypothetical protein
LVNCHLLDDVDEARFAGSGSPPASVLWYWDPSVTRSESSVLITNVNPFLTKTRLPRFATGGSVSSVNSGFVANIEPPGSRM